ncbi:hypothetical protein CAPTEDRAFT_193668 [Capitella teleta]|uniref:G-protein coupled receptors family 1 profile domain-containing protein n=1 Tax=Capitella teleta TaxID=283909 RepID=R7T7Q3_CAPTE|nr:hypothetical protein CAPTEDRAFT_193668 [Capitella teleta]|eukprot:ELT89679.1 hypothetical protein CAPTEDRAFT_193668 [Capitella teleta]
MESITFSATSAPLKYLTQNNSSIAFRIALLVIGVLGVIGNGVTLYVFVMEKKFSQSVGGVLVINQTVVDLICSLVIIITIGYAMRPLAAYQKGIPTLICFFIHAQVFLYIALTTSIYGLVLKTLERYLMVLHPVVHRNSLTKRRACIMVAFSWLLGWLHPFFSNMFTTYVDDEGVCRLQEWGSRKGQDASSIVYVVHTYVLPTLLFFIRYRRIWRILIRKKFQVPPAASFEGISDGQSEVEQSTGKITKAQINLTKTLLLTVMAFVVLWMPIEIQNMRIRLVLETPTALDLRVYRLALSLSFTNCIVNPVIYAFRLNNFKIIIMKHFCHFCCRPVQVIPQPMEQI